MPEHDNGAVRGKLKNIAPGYIHTPVLDATGLEGGYDFTLSFSPAGMARTSGGGGRGGGGPGPPPSTEASAAASDLETQKRPVSVLVIDHADQKPTEN